MKAVGKLVLIAVFMLSLPLSALAVSHEKGEMGSMKGMEHGSMKSMEGMEQGKMMMDGNMIMLGDETVDGVKAMAHLKDVKEAMSKMGMKGTHHFMVMLMDTESGKSIDSGLVAVKITDPEGKVAEPLKLMGMQGHFGVDVALTEKGEYHFQVGTKVKDGKKRTYEFSYTVK